MDTRLIPLTSDLARLLHPRSDTPRPRAIALAHEKTREFAEQNGLSESWCDAVVLEFVRETNHKLAA